MKKNVIVQQLKKAIKRGFYFYPMYGWKKSFVQTTCGTMVINSTMTDCNGYSEAGKFTARIGKMTIFGWWEDFEEGETILSIY